MKLRILHRWVRQFSITALSLCFAVGTLSATYHICDMEPPVQQQAQADMAGMDCASMNMDTESQPKPQKQCCVDFSCPKCFSSPLTTLLSRTIASPITQAALVHADPSTPISHIADGIDRPPKAA